MACRDHVTDTFWRIDSEAQESVDVDHVEAYTAKDSVDFANVARAVKLAVAKTRRRPIEVDRLNRRHLTVESFRILPRVATCSGKQDIGGFHPRHRRKHHL